MTPNNHEKFKMSTGSIISCLALVVSVASALFEYMEDCKEEKRKSVNNNKP